MRKQIVVLGVSFLALTGAYAQSDVNSQTVKDVFQDFAAGGSQKAGVEFHQKDATVGSAYIYDKWVSGSVTNTNDTVVKNPVFLFNYNKMTGALLITQDQNTYIELNKGSYKSFVLNDMMGMEHKFEVVNAINPNVSVEAVVKGHYSIYKLIKTRFKKADYQTDGLVERGNNYDEYVDEYEYYVVNSKSPAVSEKIATKRKGVKDAFGPDAGKVEAYLAQHKGDINADFLKDLGAYLNQ